MVGTLAVDRYGSFAVTTTSSCADSFDYGFVGLSYLIICIRRATSIWLPSIPVACFNSYSISNRSAFMMMPLRNNLWSRSRKLCLMNLFSGLRLNLWLNLILVRRSWSYRGCILSQFWTRPTNSSLRSCLVSFYIYRLLITICCFWLFSTTRILWTIRPSSALLLFVYMFCFNTWRCLQMSFGHTWGSFLVFGRISWRFLISYHR